MKRLISIIALLGACAAASAQDTYYAEFLSRNNYYGTARSVSLGNAVTALGGDLGSIGINPAGSAVNSFGQLTFTPALLLQSTASGWSSDGSENFGSPYKSSTGKFNVPNCGATVVLYTGNSTGLKYYTIGFLSNTTNTYLGYPSAHGTNDETSFLGNLAAAACGSGVNKFDKKLYTAFKANQIGGFGPEADNMYCGSNQMLDPADSYAYVPGTLNQREMYNNYGTKSDLLVNMGFNFSDTFYLGVNLGIPFVKYRREDGFTESAANPLAFPVNFLDEHGRHIGQEGRPTTYYKSSYNRFKLNADASGIYGKVGFIWLPVKGLRVGAAIQTPASMLIEEEWWYEAGSSYENDDFNANTQSSKGESSYKLKTPYVVNAGVAWTIGERALLSVDYELTDYSVMRYSDVDGKYNDDGFGYWDYTNQCNRLFCGVSHSLRVGSELRVLPELALRTGYSLVTSPEKYAYDSAGNMVTAETWDGYGQILDGFSYFKSNTHAFSLGVGYSSPGAFFADAAVRLTSYPTSYYAPYYFGSYDVVDKDGLPVDTGMPLVCMDKKIVDILLTVGWRF